MALHLGVLGWPFRKTSTNISWCEDEVQASGESSAWTSPCAWNSDGKVADDSECRQTLQPVGEVASLRSWVVGIGKHSWSISIVATTEEYHDLLLEFIGDISLITAKIVEWVVVFHYTITTGLPVAQRAQKLSPERFRMARTEFYLLSPRESVILLTVSGLVHSSLDIEEWNLAYQICIPLLKYRIPFINCKVVKSFQHWISLEYITNYGYRQRAYQRQ